ncbi:MAG: glycosyltransferase family 4 protein [candidate division Zixibacteria bacterium]|nr:glycosyltransferase family 4 protein [candidate division Zixibacteria bacterium]MDH3936495.1 glycosyltransferase family 4 protein [candidate division Zixibacteria bacterium]MDH4032877.1 glycosyltransferase family 4 protein [candidate division Zixibacteria bacterium]
MQTQEMIQQGEALFAEGRHDEAEKRFLEILKSDSSRKEVHNNLGVIAFEKNDMAQAAAYFEAALQIDPSYQDSLDNLEAVKDAATAGPFSGHKAAAGKLLTDARLAIVNTLGNKFNDIYRNYFSEDNDVRVITPRTVQDLAEVAEWADIIWSTWCNEATVHLSRLANCPPLATNIRSYEILTPNLMTGVNWTKVDGAIFVADHIREMANEMWSKQLSAVPQTTVHNCVELHRYPFYENGPGRDVCYIGYLNHKKGIGLLLQCIREAVKIDKAYRFHIAGSFQEKRFEVYMKHLVSEMGLSSHVDFCGWVKDVPAFLKEMNYVISTSPWEGCPNNIIESMACGIKPLIHNWRGAKDIFPEHLVFNCLDDFARLLTCSDYESQAYRRYVEVNFNVAINLPRINAFLATALERSASTPKTVGVSPVKSTS